MNDKIYNILKNDISCIKNIVNWVIDYKNDLFYDNLKKHLNYPSKFIRPILCILIQKSLFNKENENVYKIAAAIELAHNASLLHDDVIDEAQIRRNNKSFNALTNNKTAILAGDLLLSKILKLLTEIDNKEISNLFSDAICKMTEGEINQFYNRFKIPLIEEYFEKNNNKTGQLFKIAVLSPLILNGYTKPEQELTDFAYHFSNAFQIRDDINNYFGLDNDKPAQNDEKDGIYTLAQILNSKDNYKNLYEECCKILSHQVNLSIECLAFLQDNEYKQMIIKICQSLLEGKV